MLGEAFVIPGLHRLGELHNVCFYELQILAICRGFRLIQGIQGISGHHWRTTTQCHSARIHRVTVYNMKSTSQPLKVWGRRAETWQWGILFCNSDIHETVMQLVIKTTLFDAYAAYKLKWKCALSFVLPKVALPRWSFSCGICGKSFQKPTQPQHCHGRRSQSSRLRVTTFRQEALILQHHFQWYYWSLTNTGNRGKKSKAFLRSLRRLGLV